MVVGYVEIFLTAPEKSFPEKMERFGKIGQLSKSLLITFFVVFLRFLPYFLIGESYDHNSVSVVKSYIWATF